MITYTAKDIRQLLGVTNTQLFHWKRTWGMITPTIEASGRSGKDRYDYDNIVRIAVIQNLSAFGIGCKQIKHILSYKSLSNDLYVINTSLLTLSIDIQKIHKYLQTTGMKNWK